jgi:phage tail sheath protein FI
VLVLSNGPLREVQFVAAMPLPYDATLAGALESPSAAQAGSVQDAITSVLPEFDSQHGVSASSAFLQLAYPWLRTTNSGLLLERLEPPDGTLAGVLARNALLRGTFTSAAKVAPLDIVDLVPALPAYETLIPDSKPSWNNGVSKPLVVRLSLFGFTPSGIRLLSDVTTYPGEAYRPARVNRLVSVISRTARRFGESHLFEDNGPRLWAQLQQTLKKFMTRMWNAGALDGATAADAFDVRCGRDTMTQNDIDAGRMIAIVSFQAASVIELIELTLTIEASGATDSEIETQMTGVA